MKRLYLLTLVIVSVLALGCFEEEDSCNIRTPGIYVEYDVREIDGETFGEATFWVGDEPNGTHLELGACGDAIFLNGERLNEKSGWVTKYTGIVPPNDEYVFEFKRPGEDTYVSVVRNVPSPITILSPSGDSIARDDDMTIKWTQPTGDQVNLSITGNCISSYSEVITDDGLHTIREEKINVVKHRSTETCSATVTLSHYLYGDISPYLKGKIKGYTYYTAHFDSTKASDETPYVPVDTESETDTDSETDSSSDSQ